MTSRLAVRETIGDGHVALTASRALAIYRLAPQTRWSFRSVADREQLVVATAQRLAQLVGHRVHWRRTSRPAGAGEWGQRIGNSAAGRNRLPAWQGEAGRAAAHIEAQRLHDIETFFVVELPLPGGQLARILRKRSAGQLEVLVSDVDRIVAGPGLDGRPATHAEVAYLMRRSVALGCSAPRVTGVDDLGPFTADDLPELYEPAHWSTVPYGRSVKVIADRGSVALEERHVVVTALGRLPEQLPLGDPLVCRVDRLPFPVEVLVTADILRPAATHKQMESVVLRVRSQYDHWTRDHHLDAPLALQRQRDKARQVTDELDHGSELATRTDVWVRFAVAGDTEREALARAERVRDLFAPGVATHRPAGQHELARSFIPGEPSGSIAHRRRLPVTTLASFQPAVTASVGTVTGVPLGVTAGAGGKRAVCWNLHDAMERRERSGLAAVVGGLGAGKSTLVGLVAYWAALGGVAVTILDPGGPLTALCDLPELAPYSRKVPLLESQPGTLNPYSLLPDPRPEHYPTHAEYDHARTLAASQRRQLTADVLLQLLPASVAELPESTLAIRSAVRSVPSEVGTSPRRVIEALLDAGRHEQDAGIARHAGLLGGLLADVADLAAAGLIFPSGVEQLDYRAPADVRLTVLSLKGLQLPREGTPAREMTSEEQLAVPLLSLAAYLAQRQTYVLDPNARKLVAFDEVHVLSRVASGRQLINVSARESRRWNTRVLLSSQNAADLTAAGVSNLLDCAFVLRTEDADAQLAACELLRVPAEYAPVLGGLSQHARSSAGRSGYREAVWADGRDGVERIVIDLGGLPDQVRACLDTTADPAKIGEAVR